MITEPAPTPTSRDRSSSLKSLVSPDVGIVHRIDDGLVAWDHPRLAFCYATLGHTAPISGTAIDARAGGVAADPAQARAAATSEAVERYCATQIPRSRLRRARETDIGPEPSAAPRWLRRTRAPRPTDWVQGHLLHPRRAAEPAWIAASNVFLDPGVDGDLIATPTTSGLACHHEPWQALSSALLEVIERDAVMVSWYRRAQVTPLCGTLRWSGPNGEDVRFDRSPATYRLYLLPSPVEVPVVLGVAFGAQQQPPVAVGAAAHPDLATACRKALLEAHQTFCWTTIMQATGAAVPDGPDDIDDLDQHVAYYLEPLRLGAFDFLRGCRAEPRTVSLAPTPPRDPEHLCRDLIARLERANLACFAVDITSDDVRAAGLTVVRAAVPDLYPLIVGHDSVPEHPRLAPTIVAGADPHPFP